MMKKILVKYRNILTALAVLLCMAFGTAWAADTQETTVRIGFTIQNKQEKSIRIGFKLIHNYTISYDLDGGTNNASNPASYTIESPDITLQPATKTGCTFSKWTSGDKDITTIPSGTAGNLTLKANWIINQYNISFDTAGGSVVNTITQDYSSDITAPANPTKAGYTFTSWSPDIPAKMPAENMTLTANWTANTYAAAFNANNGTGTMNNQSFTYDESAKALTANTFTRSGYTFNGWNTQANGTGTSYTDGQSVQNLTSEANATVTLYAQWTIENYTIAYDLDGGTVSTANPSSYNVESSAITLNNPAKTGYTFAGWTGSNGTTPAAAITIAKGSTGNRNYKANWTLIQYGISFDLGGGVFSEENLTSYNYETQTFTLNTPTREGYEFLGWSVEGIEGLSMDVTIPQGSTENRKYTANWKATEYTISYELNGGTVSPDNPTSYTIESDDFTLTNPTKIGYDFTGWSFDTEISLDVTIPKGSTGNREYVANWTLNVYTLSYDLDGGAVSPENPASYTIESEDIRLTNPTLTGYTFAGWTGTELETASTDVTIPTGSTGNREYAANWTENVPPESPDVLQSIIVEISGDETLTMNAGASASITFTANVKGTYSQGQTIALSSDSYVLTWNMDNAEGLSLTDGTLTVNESATVGTHEVQITATAVSGDIRGTGMKTITVTVREVTPVRTVPILTCATPSITVKKGGTIAGLTIRADVMPQEWLTDGELPEGLSYRTDGNKLVISGTISSNAETGDYACTVRARNEAGTSEAMTITITVTGTGSVTPDYIEVPAGEIQEMTDEEIAETFADTTNIVLTGEVTNITETIARLESLTDATTLDLSLVTGVSELKLENTRLESITLEGNQSITKVEINDNKTLTALNLGGSKVETVDAKGCENLEEVNLEGCESLEYLDVSETAIKELNVGDCVNLGTLYCASCDISDINLEGCDSLSDLDCSNNRLLFLDASEFRNLGSLKCSHQRSVKPLARLMNFIDLLLGRGRFAVSAANEDNTYLENVKSLKAYDEAGNELAVKFDSESGEVEFNGCPAKIAYDYDTGFENTMMDVEISAAESVDGTGPGRSGAGCTLGFGAWVLVSLALCFSRKRI